jgi:hypothetical protein
MTCAAASAPHRAYQRCCRRRIGPTAREPRHPPASCHSDETEYRLHSNAEKNSAILHRAVPKHSLSARIGSHIFRDGIDP